MMRIFGRFAVLFPFLMVVAAWLFEHGHFPTFDLGGGILAVCISVIGGLIILELDE